MASGFFALLDDIATLMDDVATMSKVAAKKTAGILGDDLAVNAEKSSGFIASREIPVLWAITKGSLLNKLMILPAAFLLSAFLPLAITIILVMGGFYLAYEGAEKVYEFFTENEHNKPVISNQKLSQEQILNLEKEKIKSAIVTDFILSIEIIIIALGTVTSEGIWIQVLVVSVIAILATVGVYGIVALIIRMDNLGVRLIAFNEEENSISDFFGRLLVQALPYVIKGLSIIGTIALLLVSGGIFTHNIAFLHHPIPVLPTIIQDFIIGLVMGGITLILISVVKGIWKQIKK
jgi:predicted DNA repair protein MutK